MLNVECCVVNTCPFGLSLIQYLEFKVQNFIYRMKLSTIILINIFLLSSGVVVAQNTIGSFTGKLPRLSPVPRAVSGVKENVISLNGAWKFTGGNAVNKNIRVPGEWEMQGFKVDSAATAKYTRYFNIPADWKGKRTILRFDAVSSHCLVKVNGKNAGEHEGSFVPFENDITGMVLPGKNLLEVDVQCQTISDILACTSQYAGHPVGGILRKVTLFALPGVNVSDMTYTVQFDKQYKNALLNIPLEITNEENENKNATVGLILKDKSGKPVMLSQGEFNFKITSGNSKKDTLHIRVNRPEQWDPEHPYLYTLSTELSVDGKPTAKYRRHIGFRQVEI